MHKHIDTYINTYAYMFIHTYIYIHIYIYIYVHTYAGMYSTVFTPLTGAAVLDTNAAAGSIWGTYDSRKIIGCKGRDLKVAAMATYGKSCLSI